VASRYEEGVGVTKPWPEGGCAAWGSVRHKVTAERRMAMAKECSGPPVVKTFPDGGTLTFCTKHAPPRE